MKLYYDLHIHSALSPCGDNDMTPNNIVNMAYIKGLDIIAVTDHNSCGNVRAVQRAAEGKLMVIPGMEIETSEEVHILGLFPCIEAAEEMESIIKGCSPPIKNRPEIFGNQYYMDENDEIVGEEENLLVTATGLDIYAAVENILRLGGVPVAAHIDRTSYSVLSNLGFIPPDLKIGTVEITSANRDAMLGEYKDYVVLTSSDAHYLGDISERNCYVEVLNRDAREFLSKICKNL
ncbi:MAG: PHP domain-containing protein [Clostridia bacterium]|nr:PHP domain-containing protein [Clostridia bacterium]